MKNKVGKRLCPTVNIVSYHTIEWYIKNIRDRVKMI